MDFVEQRKNASRLICLTLFFIVYSIILVACQGLPNLNHVDDKYLTASPTLKQAKATSTIAPTPSLQPTSQFQVEASELHNLSIYFWHSWNGAEEDAIDRLVDEFNRSNEWKIKVSSIYQGGYDDIEEKVYDAINAGNYPDIVVGYPFQAANWSSVRQIILDIDTYRSDSVWGLTADEEEAYYSIFRIETKPPSGGGFPAQRTAQFLIYNKTWAEELGFTKAPTTPSEMKSQACAAHKAHLNDEDMENDNFGGLIISTDYPTTLAWIYAFGGEIVKEDGTGYRFNSSQVSDTFKYLRALYDEGCAWVSDNRPPVAEFSERKGLFISGNLDVLSLLTSSMALVGNDDEWEVLPFPSSVNSPTIEVYGPDYYILESTPAKQLASWIFIKWMARPENQAKLIEKNGNLALQPAVLELVDKDELTSPQWESVGELIAYAKPEPALPSWGVVRWAVGDATTQLFQWYFKADQIPGLVKLLDDTAANLHKATH